MARDRREYGLSESDREFVIRKKFGLFSVRKVGAILKGVEKSSDKVLGAIVFFARPSEYGDLESLVKLANQGVMMTPVKALILYRELRWHKTTIYKNTLAMGVRLQVI